MANKAAPGHDPSRPMTKLYALIAIIVVAIVLYLFLSGSKTSVLSSNTTFTLAPNKSVNFGVSDLKGSYSLFLVSSTSSAATFYISELPALTNPVSEFSLAKGQSVNVSLNGTSYAHLQVKLLSVSQSQAAVELLRIPLGFGVLQSASVHSFAPTVIVSGTSNAISSTTTVSSNSTVKSTTTSAVTQTTTVSSTGFTKAQVLTSANKTALGNILVMYDGMYAREPSCTPALYNSTFISKYGYAPTGALDYHNTSINSPTGFNINDTEVSTDEYDVTYTAIIPAGNQLSVVMLVNASSNAQISYQTSGIFKDLNFTTMSEDFVAANSISNGCAAYVG